MRSFLFIFAFSVSTLADPIKIDEKKKVLAAAQLKLAEYVNNRPHNATFEIWQPKDLPGWAQLDSFSQCQNSWPHVMVSNGDCVFLPDLNVFGWNDAELECEERGGHLATVRTKDDAVALANAYAGLPPYAYWSSAWIGAFRGYPQQVAGVYTPGQPTAGRGWSWTDGSAGIPDVWAPLEPDGNGPCGNLAFDGHGPGIDDAGTLNNYRLCGFSAPGLTKPSLLRDESIQQPQKNADSSSTITDPIKAAETKKVLAAAELKLAEYVKNRPHNATFEIWQPKDLPGWAQLDSFSQCQYTNPHVTVSNGDCVYLPDLNQYAWNDARLDCESRGGHLATVKTRNDAMLLSHAFAGLPLDDDNWSGVIVGAYQGYAQNAADAGQGMPAVGRGWAWTDGSGGIPLYDDAWMPGYPDGIADSNGHDCACSWTILVGGSGYGLDDISCSFSFYRFCAF